MIKMATEDINKVNRSQSVDLYSALDGFRIDMLGSCMRIFRVFLHSNNVVEASASSWNCFVPSSALECDAIKT